MTCVECNREETRNYRGKPLCELHYAMENPDRNINFADWDAIGRMRKLNDKEIAFISIHK